MDTDALQPALDALRQAIPGLLAVYVYGSVARDEAHDGSDVDIAILAEHPVDAVERFDLAGKLASQLGRDVDLLDLKQASTVMRAQVMESAHRLWVRDDAPVDEFEAHVLSDFARLNEERAAILNEIRERGSVYAR